MKLKIYFCVPLWTIVFLAIAPKSIAQDSSLIVGLKSGKVIHANQLKLKEPLLKSSYILVNESEKYPIQEVKYYQDQTGYYSWARIDAYGKEVKLKRELTGNVNTYSRLVSSYSYNEFGGMYSTTKVEYFQKGQNEINKINYENLSRALSDNAASASKLDETKSLKTLNVVAYVVGGGLLIGGLAHMNSLNQNEGSPPYEDTSIKFSPLFFIGAATLTIPLFTKSPMKRKLNEAIAIYNK